MYRDEAKEDPAPNLIKYKAILSSKYDLQDDMYIALQWHRGASSALWRSKFNLISNTF